VWVFDDEAGRQGFMTALVVQHCREAAPLAEGLMLMSMNGTSVPECAHFNSSVSG